MSSNEHEMIVNANRLAERISEAKRMRAEGRPEEEIRAVEPTKEEVRNALIALRSRRVAMPTPKPRKKSQSKMDLGELLGDL